MLVGHWIFLVSQDDMPDACTLLVELNETNRKRQKIEENILREISGSLANGDFDTRKSIVLYNQSWHLGVVGIVAKR